MTRFSRINTIWRKELIDTLRDKRTVIAMVLVPMVLYPALMLGSLQAFEMQTTRLKQESYKIGVATEEARRWLRRLIDTDAARRMAGPGAAAEDVHGAAQAPVPAHGGKAAETARTDVRSSPPPYEIVVVEPLREAVAGGQVHAGLAIQGPLPVADGAGTARVALLFDQTDIRSEIAAAGLDGILQRANDQMVQQRLERFRLGPEFLSPLSWVQNSVATEERMGGSILGQIVPLILIMMTITGAIYPAIDLTAGERERGTLETLMVAPVPTVDLIAGKFIVVTLIGLLSALLNLASIGGTIYFGGLGDLLTRGSAVQFPLSALPKIMLLLVPLAVLFSALLLAVCSFARSFKEAQNYIMPVMVAALIPGVVGIIPGTRLEGPILIMPVANVVVLARDLFLGRSDIQAILWVVLSTSMYAAAAVAVAAKLFGQEAVLFADSASIKTLFQRRFFKPSAAPTAAQAFLLLALIYPLNFFVQQALFQSPLLRGNVGLLGAIALVLLLLFLLTPLLAAFYMRVDVRSAFSLAPPPWWAILAALCFGCSTWILAQEWMILQKNWLGLDPDALAQEFQKQFGWLERVNPYFVFFAMAIVPAVCEEFFFRGYALGGLRKTLGAPAAIFIVSLAFGVYHGNAVRLIVTAGLGMLFGLLVVRGGSLWPAMAAHLMHNGISILSAEGNIFESWLQAWGYRPEKDGSPPTAWVMGALLCTFVGIGLCIWAPRRALPLATDESLLKSEPAR